jgi:hypothetical protein
MGTEPESAPATEELLEGYARLSLERDELATRVAERELASHRPPTDAPRRSRRRNTLLWLAVVLSSTITPLAVVGTAAILAGFWDPLGNDATPTPLAVPALPPLVELSAAEPQPAPTPARTPSPSPPAHRGERARDAPAGHSPNRARNRRRQQGVVAPGKTGIAERFPPFTRAFSSAARSASLAARRLWFGFAVSDLSM